MTRVSGNYGTGVLPNQKKTEAVPSAAHGKTSSSPSVGRSSAKEPRKGAGVRVCPNRLPGRENASSSANLIAVSTGQDFDTIPAAEIQRDNNIEFPSNNPDVQWRFDENRALKPPCNQPGVQWFVEKVGEPLLGSPLGDLYSFTVKEVGGAGAEVEVKIRGHVPVRRYRRHHA